MEVLASSTSTLITTLWYLPCSISSSHSYRHGHQSLRFPTVDLFGVMTVPQMQLQLLPLVALLITAAFWAYRRRRSPGPLPPGPAGLPLIGNALQLELSHPWLYYTKIAKQFGKAEPLA